MGDGPIRPITTSAQIHTLAAACEEYHARVDQHGITWTLSDTVVGAVLVSASAELIYARHTTET